MIVKRTSLIRISNRYFIELKNSSLYEWGQAKKDYKRNHLFFRSLIIIKRPLKFLYSIYRFIISIKMPQKFKVDNRFKYLPVVVTLKFPNEDFNYKKIYKKYFGYFKPPNHIYIEVNEESLCVYEVNNYNREVLFRLSLTSLFYINTFHAFKLFILRLIPIVSDKAGFEIITNLIYSLLKIISPRYIIFPYEGQLWEKALIEAANNLDIKSIGIVHALNITARENNRIKYIEGISPKELISTNSFQRDFLIKKKEWPSSIIKLRKINRDYKNLLSPANKINLLIDNNSINILLLGSYLTHEDDAGFKIASTIVKYNTKFKLYYKPHPSTTLQHQNSIANRYESLVKTRFIKSINIRRYNLILSPSSSSSSIELVLSGCNNLLIFQNCNYHTPDIFYQFKIQVAIVDQETSYQEINKLLSIKNNIDIEIQDADPLILNNNWYK